MRLNVWQRLGVVLSAGGALAGGAQRRQFDLTAAENFRSLSYKICIEEKQSLEICAVKASASFQLMMKHSWQDVLLGALLPVWAVWLIVCICLLIARWVFAGREEPGAEVLFFKQILPTAAVITLTGAVLLGIAIASGIPAVRNAVWETYKYAFYGVVVCGVIGVIVGGFRGSEKPDDKRRGWWQRTFGN